MNWNVLDIAYEYKKKKLDEAEREGYEKARKLYKKKIAELKTNFEKLRKKGNSEIQEALDLINDIMKEISDTEMKIADLEIVLND